MARVLVNPKGITLYSEGLSGVLKAIFHLTHSNAGENGHPPPPAGTQKQHLRRKWSDTYTLQLSIQHMFTLIRPITHIHTSTIRYTSASCLTSAYTFMFQMIHRWHLSLQYLVQEYFDVQTGGARK